MRRRLLPTDAELTEEEVGATSMCQKLPIIVFDIAKGKEIQLFLTTTASDVDWKQDGPSDQATDKTNDDGNLQEAQEEEAIESMGIEDVRVGHLVEATKPSKELVAKFRRSFTVKARREISDLQLTDQRTRLTSDEEQAQCCVPGRYDEISCER